MKRLICLLLIFVLLFSLFSNIVLSADEVSQITLSYKRSENWQDFSGKTIFADYLDCLRIQTDPKKDYCLSYKTWNEDAPGYFSEVKSNSQNLEDYAGISGKRIRNLSISVLDKEGNSIDENIIVMYRAYVDGVWLPWVSNAKIEWMSYVQRKYKLDGVLDDKSYNAGINSSYISGLEIRVFEEKSIDDQKGITKNLSL